MLTKKIISVLICAFLLGNSLVFATSDSDLISAVSEAQSDAKSNINSGLWFALGCLFPLWGNVGALLYEPSVPTMPLIGKSPEYVAAYTDTYLSESKNKQSKSAMYGCITGTVIYTVSYVGFVVAVVAASETSY